MSEYWVSKKQYWCKYCSIWIRDDAPSRSLHESGGKHQGNKERYIREIYRGGERAKREKEANAREFARIEAAAAAAHAKDTGVHAGRPAPDAFSAPPASSSRAPRPPKAKAPGDKWANYSSASQLGFDDEETKLSSYEIEQMVRGRGTTVGQWEEVKAAPAVAYGEDGVPMVSAPAPEAEQDNHENFKFSHKDKRPIRDVYGDDDWDPAALTGIKLRTKERKIGDVVGPSDGAEAGTPNPKAGWSKIGDKVEMKEDVKVERAQAEENVKEEGVKGEKGVKAEESVKMESVANEKPTTTVTPTTNTVPAAITVKTESDTKPAGSGSLFKKRRPPPSSRK